jgi:hypothetical protein
MTDVPERALATAEAAWTDAGDTELSAIVRAANSGRLHASVALWVSGAVVSGQLVGVSDYFDALADLLESRRADPAFVAEYRAKSASVHEIVADDGEYAIDADYTVAYIHLRDARDWSTAGDPVKGLLWRGRIDHVDAWSLGSPER